MVLGIGIPTRDRPEHLARCLASLANQTFMDFRVVVVNDNSGSRDVDPCRFHDFRVDIIEGDRKGPPFAHQRALEFFGPLCDVIMRVDDDVTLDPTCVAKLYSELQCHDDWGIAAPIVWWGDKTYGHYTDDYNTSRVQWRGHKDDRPKIVKHVGTTFMYRVKDAFDIGGWPLCYSRVAYREETDFCFRMRLLANKDIAVVPKAFSHHHLAKHGGISRSDKEYAELELKDKETFAKRAKEWGVEDPDYEVDNNLLGVWDTLEYY